MSHSKERKEKNCLNCNAHVNGRFCHICGQENVEPAESVWQLITHFFNDLTHFDGKFFSTSKYLIFKPGYLSVEYKEGRRASYLNPIRMYIFTSAVFFLVFFASFEISEVFVNGTMSHKGVTFEEIKQMDTVEFRRIADEKNFDFKNKQLLLNHLDSINRIPDDFNINGYSSRAAFDSSIASGTNKHSQLKRFLTKKILLIKEKYNYTNTGEFLADLLNTFIHMFPQMFFISLPVFALLMKLLYYRRKSYYYTNHLIFTVHYYIFVFIALLIVLGLNKMEDVIGETMLINIIKGGILFTIFFYLYKAIRNYFDQGRMKTFLNLILLGILYFSSMAFLFVIFFIVSIFKL